MPWNAIYHENRHDRPYEKNSLKREQRSVTAIQLLILIRRISNKYQIDMELLKDSSPEQVRTLREKYKE